MTVHPNGTDAKDISLYFAYNFSVRVTHGYMAKTVNQAKLLLEQGYTKDDIMKVIKYIADGSKNPIHSFGYIIKVMDDTLQKIRTAEKAEQELAKLDVLAKQMQNEVSKDGESTERNRVKARDFGIQSRFGEKFNFNLLEGLGQDH